MCIAIFQKIGGKVSDDALRQSFKSNNDGAGYAFVGTKGMVVKKGYFNIDSFIKDLRADEEKFAATSPFLIHFRISTGGGINADNCHPFLFEHGALIHNGWFFHGSDKKSDTNLLVEAIGKKLTKKNANANKEALESKFGKGNKVAVLFNDKSFIIFNESGGEWVDNIWYSNRSYCGYKSVTPGPVGGQLVPSGHRFRDSNLVEAGKVVTAVDGYDDDDLPWNYTDLPAVAGERHTRRGALDY